MEDSFVIPLMRISPVQMQYDHCHHHEQLRLAKNFDVVAVSQRQDLASGSRDGFLASTHLKAKIEQISSDDRAIKFAPGGMVLASPGKELSFDLELTEFSANDPGRNPCKKLSANLGDLSAVACDSPGGRQERELASCFIGQIAMTVGDFHPAAQGQQLVGD